MSDYEDRANRLKAQLGYGQANAAYGGLREQAMAEQDQVNRQLAAQAQAFMGVDRVQVRVVEKIVEKRVLPSQEELARALWNTDERVSAFIAEVSDSTIHVDFGWFYIDGERSLEARRRAWDRDEHGWRTEALHRAEVMLLIHLSVPSGGTGESK